MYSKKTKIWVAVGVTAWVIVVGGVVSAVSEAPTEEPVATVTPTPSPEATDTETEKP